MPQSLDPLTLVFNAFEERRMIDKFIENLALSRVDKFYPSALATHLGISSKDAFIRLLEMTGPREPLNLKWEARCPYCSRTLNITNEEDIDELICNCGAELELQPTDFYPLFQIKKDYKEALKNELKKKNHTGWRPLQMI